MPITDRRARALLSHRYLLRLALAAGNVFAWIVVFRVFYTNNANLALSLAGTALLFAVVNGISLLLTPLAGAALRHGVRRALVLGSFSAALSFAFLAELFLSRYALHSSLAFWLIAGFVICSGIYRALYFVPYAAAAVRNEARSRPFLREISLALVPLVAGFLIVTLDGGAAFLFSAAAGVCLLALFLLARTPEVYERFDWSYGETFAALFSSFHWRGFWSSIFDGVQGAVLILIWPLAAFIILGQSFFALGVVLSLTLVFAFAGRAIMRKLLRSLRVDKSPAVLATIAFSSWIFRLGAGSPIQIVVADVYYHTGSEPRRRGIDAHSHDQWADGGHYIDEFTALKEMGLAMGRIAVCVVFAAFAYFTSPALAFALSIVAAAVAAAASVILSHRLTKESQL